MKQDKLAYIANKDRPSAPSFQVERLAKTLPKSQGSAEMAQPTPRFSLRVLRELEKFPPNSPAAMRFLKQALMSAGMPPELSRPASRGRHSLHSTATSAKIGFADASSQEVDRAEGEEEALVATASTGTTGSGADSQAFPVAAPALLDTANLGATGNLSHTSISLRTRSASSPEHIRGLDMSRMLPRYKPDTGAPTLCGYQVPKGTDSVEGDYNAVVGKHHIPTPDLSRSGKDHIDQLQRLGYVPPGSLASPVYPEYESPVNWAHPQGWMRATKAKSTGGHVSMDQMLPRRPATSQGASSQATPLHLCCLFLRQPSLISSAFLTLPNSPFCSFMVFSL